MQFDNLQNDNGANVRARWEEMHASSLRQPLLLSGEAEAILQLLFEHKKFVEDKFAEISTRIELVTNTINTILHTMTSKAPVTASPTQANPPVRTRPNSSKTPKISKQMTSKTATTATVSKRTAPAIKRTGANSQSATRTKNPQPANRSSKRAPDVENISPRSIPAAKRTDNSRTSSAPLQHNSNSNAKNVDAGKLETKNNQTAFDKINPSGGYLGDDEKLKVIRDSTDRKKERVEVRNDLTDNLVNKQASTLDSSKEKGGAILQRTEILQENNSTNANLQSEAGIADRKESSSVKY